MMYPPEAKNSGRKLPSRSDVRVEGVLGGMSRKRTRKIATWNVNTLLQSGKLENLKIEMRRLSIDILGISEMRWPNVGDFWSDEFRVIHTGSSKGNAGVGVILNKECGLRVKSYLQVTERIIMVKIEAKPSDLVIIQVYMPTGAYEDEEVEEVYDEIEKLINMTKGKENLIILGDWNAAVGEGAEAKTVGKFGLGNRNERGERLVEFCAQHNMVIANTLFQHHQRRQYTYVSPGDRSRRQIDYILVRQRFRNQIKQCKTYPGADLKSDHQLLMLKSELSLKKLSKKKPREEWNLKQLQVAEVQEAFEKTSAEKIGIVTKESSIEEKWCQIKVTVKNTANEVLGKKTKEIRKPWITEEIVDLIETRRKYKNAQDENGKQRYKEIHNQINRLCKMAKENWYEEKCQNVDKLIKSGRSDAAYKIVKQDFQERNPKTSTLRDINGKILLEDKEKASRWKEYLENLYRGCGEDYELENVEDVDPEEMGDSILWSEFEDALKHLKSNKASGVDQIPAELLKCCGEKVKKALFHLCNEMYLEGSVTRDFERNVMVMLPKKPGTDICENYRTISLTTHASKILTRIVLKRIENKIDVRLGDDQFGFRRNRGTREGILALRVLLEKQLKKGKDTYIAFVDAEKAFDNVEWKKMFETLRRLGVTYNDRRAIYNVYRKQTAVIRVGDAEEEAQIRKGVRQGCNLSPAIFNAYIEEAMTEWKEAVNTGVNVGGVIVNTLRFADDIAVLAESENDLQEMLQKMDQILNVGYNLRVNKKKTKVMVCSRNEGKSINIKLGDEMLEQVREFCYLGSKITEDGRSKREIISRIAQAKKSFQKKKTLLTSNNISTDVKKKFIQTYIWSVALYGCETWTIATEEQRRLEAFEMWCYRRMMKIPWVDKISNEEVLKRAMARRKLWKQIQTRRDKMVGHILRHDSLLKTIIEGNIEGKNARGRPRLEYMTQIREDVGKSSYTAMKRMAQHRAEWRAAANQSKD